MGKHRVKKVTKFLQENGIKAEEIHGNKSQSRREAALAQFKRGEVQILVATNVASRGLHVDDIDLVITFDFGSDIEEYVHRIGRTGRAGNKGKAITFFTNLDGYLAKELVKVMRATNQKIPDKLLNGHYSRGEKLSPQGKYGAKSKEIDSKIMAVINYYKYSQ